MTKPQGCLWVDHVGQGPRSLDLGWVCLTGHEGIDGGGPRPGGHRGKRPRQSREEVNAVAGRSQPGRRWRRRVGWVLAVLVVGPILAVGVLWPLTPGVDGAAGLVRANLAAVHGAELVVLPSPDRVGQALIATEDSRFFWTPGIDPVSVLRVGLAALTGRSDTGGATLEQQLAKNLYFPHDDGVLAKVKEGELALKLDASYSKNEVLRLYLAGVYFGHGFYGLPAAASGYFARTPSQLSWPAASMLAGLVQAPSAYDPTVHLPAARLRQRHVLDRLVATGVLPVKQGDAVFAAPLGLR